MLDIYKDCLFNRRFEIEAAQSIHEGLITCPTYLSVGTEHIPVLLKKALDELGITKYSIFGQHRCHSYFNTFIQRPLELALELCGSPLGCNQGKGGSASISGIRGDVKMFGHDGLLGTNGPIAVGYADASKELTICIVGDAAVEEDYFLGCLGYAATKKCSILFICEDNDLSILTDKKTRRSWNINKIAQSFQLATCHLLKFEKFNQIIKDLKEGIKMSLDGLPSFITFDVCRHYWHAGAGKDGPPKYDYLDSFQDKLRDSHNIQSKLIEIEQIEKAYDIWVKQLPKLLQK